MSKLAAKKTLFLLIDSSSLQQLVVGDLTVELSFNKQGTVLDVADASQMCQETTAQTQSSRTKRRNPLDSLDTRTGRGKWAYSCLM